MDHRQLSLTEDERHVAFRDAQARAYQVAVESTTAETSLEEVGMRHEAFVWAAVANALRKETV